MKFIYHCFGGSHSSVTAAAIHVGLLSEERLPERQELLSLPYYDAQVSKDHGRIRFIGFDKAGNEVYITSKRNLGFIYEKIMRQILQVADRPELNGQLIFVNTMTVVNIFMIIGGYLSRRLGWTRLGRSIVIYGTRQSFHKFTHLVRQVKEKYYSGG